MLAFTIISLVALESSLVSTLVQLPKSALHATLLRRESNAYPLTADDLANELLTSEWIAKIAQEQENECLNPMHVHLVWIGDIDKAPPTIHNYTDRGYRLAVHSSTEEILDGFHPYVLKAFKQAVPQVVGFDSLKFALLYKHGGLVVDADTTPSIRASELEYPMECDIIFGKETHLPKGVYAGHPKYITEGARDYPFSRPYQLLNWAMVASKPRNKHIKKLMEISMMHFFGLRDTEFGTVQDMAGSGPMTDYFALLHEREGRNFPDTFDDPSIVPVDGACMTDGHLTGGWIQHPNLGSWKNSTKAGSASKSDETASARTGSKPGSDKTNSTNADSESRSDETNSTQEDSETVFRELMTPEWIAHNESQMSDPLSPMQVHLLWIGDLEKAPKRIHEYNTRGFALTVHTSAEEVLDGFRPLVVKAFKQAVPRIVGLDFLKFALLYKHGGLVVDADTTPGISASKLNYPTECDVVFGKEAHLPKGMYAGHPKYRNDGKRDYGLNRPYQILNWAMAASKPRNEHIRKLVTMAIMHFFGQRDMNGDLIQDIAGSGLMTDYVSLLHEAEGRSYPEVFENQETIPVQGICLADNLFTGAGFTTAFSTAGDMLKKDSRRD
ncbi:hypothetical protein FI667_g17635, partial [Globisporangium splendens]